MIKEVGPIPGFYLNQEHTRKVWKKEQFMPQVSDREAYQEWLRGDTRKDIIYLAQERIEEMLATYEPKPLKPEQDKEIDQILDEARKLYEERGLI